MLQNFLVYFQWFRLTVGGSMQHGRDMEQQRKCQERASDLPELASAKPTEIDASSLVAKIEDAFRGFARRFDPTCKIDGDALRGTSTVLACLCAVQPSSSQEVGRAAATRELNGLAADAEKLADSLGKLSRTTVKS
ncbi:MAG: hypothetical protein WCA56_13700, partial [Xanthobacteraceae bacterium]